MRCLLLLFPLALTGCLHTGTFEAPVPVPSGRSAISVGATASRALGDLPDFEARLGFTTGAATWTLRGTPASAGAGVRVQVPAAVPLALLAGGSIAFEVDDCAYVPCAKGPSGYLGVAVGDRRPGPYVPYLSARLVASGVDEINCDDEGRCRRSPVYESVFGAVSVGAAPRRGGIHVEAGLVGKAKVDVEGPRLHLNVAPTFGVLLKVLL